MEPFLNPFEHLQDRYPSIDKRLEDVHPHEDESGLDLLPTLKGLRFNESVAVLHWLVSED